jgi:hypothetical protein
VASGELQQVTVTSDGVKGTLTSTGTGVHLTADTLASSTPGALTVTVPDRLLTRPGVLTLEEA